MNESREAIRQKLVHHSLRVGALKFGEFTLKSERISPYFFDSALLADGQGLAFLAAAYASTLAAEAPRFDVLYGPPYKGIPLAAVTGATLSARMGINCKVMYSRKEDKRHGERGKIVGGSLAGKRVFLVDDVITAGTAIAEACALIKEYGDERTKIVGAIVVLDRQEREADSRISAVQAVEQKFGFKVLSVFNLDYLVREIERSSGVLAEVAAPWLNVMRQYREQYGA